MKKRNSMYRLSALLIAIAVFVSATYIPSMATNLYDQYMEQKKWKEILQTDMKKFHPQESPTLKSDEQSIEKEEESKTDTVQAESEASQSISNFAIGDDKATRFIVAYNPTSSALSLIHGGEDAQNLQMQAAAIGEQKATAKVGNTIKSAEQVSDIVVVETTAEMTSSQVLNVLDDNTIRYVQPDYTMTASEADPLLCDQWGHAQPQENQAGADVVEAWSESIGENVIIAVIDTGINASHEDLQENILDDWDFVNNTSNVQDNSAAQGHGTQIAGIIAAQKDNGAGIAGVAPGAKILPLKVFQNGVAYTSDIIAAIAYAEEHHATIANCSWGSRFENPALQEAMENSSMLFVCAAGNGLYNVDEYPVYPAAFDLDNIISVTSIDANGHLSRFANYGIQSVDIAAPGNNILTTWIDGGYQPPAEPLCPRLMCPAQRHCCSHKIRISVRCK